MSSQIDMKLYNNAAINTEIIDKLLASNDLFDMDLKDFVGRHAHQKDKGQVGISL